MQGVSSLSELIENFKGIVSEDVVNFQKNKHHKVPSQSIVGVTNECLLSLNPYPHSAAPTSSLISRLLEQAVDSKQHSTITLLGDTGSGKSFLSTYLIGLCGISSEYQSLLSHAQTIVRSLTCAKTVESERSSRCTTGYELFFEKGTTELNYAQIKIYFLEAIRVTLNQLERPGEHNFDFVYSIMAGRPNLFDTNFKGLKYLQTRNSEFQDFDAVAFKKSFEEVDASLKIFSLETDSIYDTMAAIVLLGNLEFGEVNSRTVVIGDIAKIEKMLGLDDGVLGDILTKIGDLNDTMGIAMAQTNRDIIAKYLYRRLVTDTVDKINNKLKSSAKSTNSKIQRLVIYDTFGFEDYAREASKGNKQVVYNSFPQLIHNCIQEEVVFNVLEHFKKAYGSDQIPTNILKFLLLSPEQKDLNDKSQLGLLEVLKNAAKLKSGSEVNIMGLIKDAIGSDQIREIKNKLEINHFTLMKSDKSPGVLYNLSDVRSQAREDIPAKLEILLYDTNESSKKKTTIDYFQSDYDTIDNTTNKLTQYFIMCVNPCTRPASDFEFNTSYMSRQYCSLGLSALFSLNTSGMEALSQSDFITQYSFLAPDSEEEDSKHCEEIFKHLEINQNDYVIGVSRVFMSPECIVSLKKSTLSKPQNFVIQTTPKKAYNPVNLSPTHVLSQSTFTKESTIRKRNLDFGSLRANDNGKVDNENENNTQNNTNYNVQITNQMNTQNVISNSNYTYDNGINNGKLPQPAAPTLYNNITETRGENKEGEETKAATETANRLAKLREKKQDRYHSLVDETKGAEKETPKEANGNQEHKENEIGKWKGKGRGQHEDPWCLISRATELQTFAIQDKMIIPGLSRAITESTELMESGHEGAAALVSTILCPIISEHAHRFMSDSGMLSLSQYLLSVKLDPAQEYSRMYRLDRIVSEILEHKQTNPTVEGAFEMTLLFSERMQRELYRIPIFFDKNSLLLTIRALTKVVNDNPRNVALKAFLGFGLLESIVLLLVKTTTPSRHPLYPDLIEKLSEFLFTCSRHDFITEYFRNNGGYAGLVVAMKNIIEVTENEITPAGLVVAIRNIVEGTETEITPEIKNTLDIILKMLTGLENKYHGNLVKLAASQEGKIVSVHTVLLDILKSKVFGEQIYLQVIELIKLISPVFALAKPNEVPNALTVFFSAGHHVRFYKDIMNTNFLDLMTSPPTHSLTPPPPVNDWTPFICCMIFHVLHFHENSTIREVSACLQSFDTLMILKRNCELWDCLIGIMRSLDVDFARVADIHANHKIRELEKSNLISTWIVENTPVLEKFCGKKLAKNEIDYKLYKYYY